MRFNYCDRRPVTFFAIIKTLHSFLNLQYVGNIELSPLFSVSVHINILHCSVLKISPYYPSQDLPSHHLYRYKDKDPSYFLTEISHLIIHHKTCPAIIYIGIKTKILHTFHSGYLPLKYINRTNFASSLKKNYILNFVQMTHVCKYTNLCVLE